MCQYLGEGRGVEPASALALPKTESGATDTLGADKKAKTAQLGARVNLGSEDGESNLLLLWLCQRQRVVRRILSDTPITKGRLKPPFCYWWI